MSTPRLVVFSDLDGTLLDHHSYSFEPARPALDALAARGIPLVLATSKTIAELHALRAAIGTSHPAIAENGGHVLVPRGYFEALAGDRPPPPGPDAEIALGMEYAQVRGVLTALREDPRFRFVGFGDLDDAGVAAITGLPVSDAALARARRSSEPLQWQGAEADVAAFRAALEARGLRLTRGGRFFHAQAPIDKADGLRFLMTRYASACGVAPHSIAAGDGDNDLGMLRAANRAIVIPPSDPTRRPLSVPGAGTIIAARPGPAGWATSILQILNELDKES